MIYVINPHGHIDDASLGNIASNCGAGDGYAVFTIDQQKDIDLIVKNPRIFAEILYRKITESILELREEARQ